MKNNSQPLPIVGGGIFEATELGNQMREQNFRSAAFDTVCRDAKEPETWYLCLIESFEAYGGPEEGGWWQQIDALYKYQEFPSEKEAKKAANRIYSLANELTREATNAYGWHCERQTDWLEERGLESDYFPENDGPSYFRVWVGTELPVFDNTRQTYE